MPEANNAFTTLLQDLRVWLIEVNKRPGMGCGTVRSKFKVPTVLARLSETLAQAGLDIISFISGILAEIFGP